MSSLDYLATGREDAVPLVCLHGIGTDGGIFAPQLRALSSDYRVIAINLPGYGRSSLPADGALTIERLRHAVLATLDELALDTVHLLGHSLGGMVALDIAAEAPTRVSSLVLSAATPAFGSRDGSFQERFVQARLAPLDAGATLAELAHGIVAGLVGEEADPAGTALAEACVARLDEATYRAAIACLTTFDRREALAELDVPCLVIAGEHDRNAPLPTLQKMAARVPGARLHVLRGAGHLANIERPHEYNRVLRRFLEVQR